MEGHNNGTFGGVEWESIFEDQTILDSLAGAHDAALHIILASASWDTRAANSLATKLAFMQALKPVILAPGHIAASRIGSTTIPQVLFLPKYCSPLVGWFFKPDTAYDEYLEVFKGITRQSPLVTVCNLLGG